MTHITTESMVTIPLAEYQALLKDKETLKTLIGSKFKKVVEIYGSSQLFYHEALSDERLLQHIIRLADKHAVSETKYQALRNQIRELNGTGSRRARRILSGY